MLETLTIAGVTALLTALVTAPATGFVQYAFGTSQDRSRQFRELRAKYVAEFLDLAIKLTFGNTETAHRLDELRARAARAALFLSDDATNQMEVFILDCDVRIKSMFLGPTDLRASLERIRAQLKAELARD